MHYMQAKILKIKKQKIPEVVAQLQTQAAFQYFAQNSSIAY